MKSNNILLKNARLIDGTGEGPVSNVSISMTNGIIDSIISDIDSAMQFPGNCRIIELNGLTVLPGLINSHVHSGLNI